MDVNEGDFDLLFAEIMGEGDKPEQVVAVSDEPEVVPTVLEALEAAPAVAVEVAREAAVEDLISTSPVINAGPVAKPVYPTADKVPVEGTYFRSQVYTRLGYVSILFDGFRFANKFIAYRSDLKKFVEFCRSAECDAWLASLEAAGLRDRGEARKEG